MSNSFTENGTDYCCVLKEKVEVFTKISYFVM